MGTGNGNYDRRETLQRKIRILRRNRSHIRLRQPDYLSLRKKGCVETEVSCSALYRKFIEHLQAGETSIILSEKDIEEITLDDIFSAINREDLLAIELVEQIGQQLGFHIGSLINTFNPDMVIIGGEISRAGDFLLQPVISAIRKYTLSLMSRDSEIVLSKLKDQACVIGSCLLSRSKLFEA